MGEAPTTSTCTHRVYRYPGNAMYIYPIRGPWVHKGGSSRGYESPELTPRRRNSPDPHIAFLHHPSHWLTLLRVARLNALQQTQLCLLDWCFWIGRSALPLPRGRWAACPFAIKCGSVRDELAREPCLLVPRAVPVRALPLWCSLCTLLRAALPRALLRGMGLARLVSCGCWFWQAKEAFIRTLRWSASVVEA